MKKTRLIPKRKKVLFLPGWYSHPLHQGVVTYAKKAGWILDNTMCYSGKIPSEWEGDGILCRQGSRTDIIELCQKASVPVVGWEADERLPIPRVYVDQEKMGELAALHLMERGYRRLGFFHLGVAQYQLPRMHAFKKTVEAQGGKFFNLSVPGEGKWPLPSNYDWSWLKEKLAHMGLPAGIMVLNDAQAPPLLQALEELGIAVPENISVIGAENIVLLCDVGTVPLSSVEANHHEMGLQAAALLDRLMAGEKNTEKLISVSPGPVVLRDSTNMLSVENEYAATALRYIWDHYREAISVEDVAASVPISRRRLQTLFLSDVGRTLQEEINRVRVEAACLELEKGTLKIQEIASLCGFSSNLHLYRAFIGIFGMGPKAYAEHGRPEDVPRQPCPLH